MACFSKLDQHIKVIIDLDELLKVSDTLHPLVVTNVCELFS